MRQREWARLIRSLGQLTHRQRQQVMAELVADEGRVKALSIVEESAGIEVSCPHCQGKHVVRNGTADGLQRYKCRCCKATFNALTGTPLARLRMKSKWLGQTGVLRDGVTITEAAERLGVARSTAFRWRHRFLAQPKTVQAKVLVGIAETDETYSSNPSRACATGCCGRHASEAVMPPSAAPPPNRFRSSSAVTEPAIPPTPS